jgi:ubiquinone/menaquinone biosynthesis C-methylase UbiE
MPRSNDSKKGGAASSVAAHVWNASPAGTTHAGSLAPGSFEFFETVLKRRSQTELSWLPQIIPFERTSGRSVLELGCGAGYDAYEFSKQQARYVGIDIAGQNLVRTRTHLGFYGYAPQVLCGDVECLPFQNNSFEILYSFGVLHHTPDIEKSLREAHRVLKPSGELWLAVYHKNSIFYWASLYLKDHIIGKGYKKRTFEERLSMVEYTTSEQRPIVNVYSRHHFKNLLSQAGFKVCSLQVRKLQAADLPFQTRITIPQAWLDFIGRFFGWYLIAKAEKE